MVREGFIRSIFQQRVKGVREQAIQICRGRVFQAEEAASAKTLRKRHSRCLKSIQEPLEELGRR